MHRIMAYLLRVSPIVAGPFCPMVLSPPALTTDSRNTVAISFDEMLDIAQVGTTSFNTLHLHLVIFSVGTALLIMTILEMAS